MSKVLKPFENHLKEVMSNYEAPYDVRSWQDLQKRISGKSAGNSVWLVAALATVLVTGAGVFGIYKQRYTPSSAQASQSEPRFATLFSVLNSDEITDPTTSSELDQTVISNAGAALTEIASTSENNQPLVSDNDTQTPPIEKSAQALSSNSELHSASNNDGLVKGKKIQFNSSVSEGCTGVEVDFQVSGPNKGSYLWNFGDGKYSNDVNPKHKFTKSGVYDVSLSITDDQGHITVTTMPDLVTIHPSPDASFEWDFVNESPESPTVKIINTSEYAVKYEWKFADGTTSNLVSPVKSFDGKGKHTVALEVTNENGCSDATVKQISINTEFKLGEQASITPGKQTFMPAYLKENKQNFKLEIYDENGVKVYETTNRKEGWDGTMPNDTPATVGSSFEWKVIIYTDNSKDKKYFNGTLTITP
ncbi:MAG: PKD domain-containing protein [Flavobacteriales bacterium]